MRVAASVVALLALAFAAWAGIRAARSRPVLVRQLVAGAVVEGTLALQAVLAAVLLLTGHALGDPVVFWGYLITALLVLPVAALWAIADSTRWGSTVLVVAGLTVAVLELRLVQIWEAGAA